MLFNVITQEMEDLAASCHNNQLFVGWNFILVMGEHAVKLDIVV